MSSYRDYTAERIRRELEEEARHKEDPTPEDYEAALDRLGVNTSDQNGA